MGQVTSNWDDSAHMPAAVRQTLRADLSQSTLGVSRVQSENRYTGTTAPYETHSAYLVVLQLRPFTDQTLWVDGKRAPHAPFAAGGVAIYDLERHWQADLHDAYDCMHFYLPQVGVDNLAEEMGCRRQSRLVLPPHLNAVDPTVHQIGKLLLPALDKPHCVPQLFVDHVAMGLHAHLVRRYGDCNIAPVASTGRLAAWQERRARDHLLANLGANVSLEDLARDCGLSRSHFSKAFRQTTGLPPHQWLLQQRVAKAQQMIRASSHSLSDIAAATGFADQSHLTRVFVRLCGTTPAAWRRSGARDQSLALRPSLALTGF